MSIDFFFFVGISVSCRPRDYEFIHLVWKKSHDEIRLGEFVKDRKFPEKKTYQYHQILATGQLRIVKSLRMRYC